MRIRSRLQQLLITFRAVIHYLPDKARSNRSWALVFASRGMCLISNDSNLFDNPCTRSWSPIRRSELMLYSPLTCLTTNSESPWPPRVRHLDPERVQTRLLARDTLPRCWSLHRCVHFSPLVSFRILRYIRLQLGPGLAEFRRQIWSQWHSLISLYIIHTVGAFSVWSQVNHSNTERGSSAGHSIYA